jgi:hypothetical protein
MKTRPLFFIATLACASIPMLSAQEIGTSISGQASRQSADEVEDIGVIQETESVTTDGKSSKEVAPPEARTKFRFNVGARASYTSNAQLSGNHSSSDVIFMPSLEAGMRTNLGRGFGFDAVARVESGIYADYHDRTFVGYSVQTTLDYRPRPHLPRIYIGAEPYRYDSFDRGERITQAIGVSAGTDWGYAFNQGNSLLTLGYNFTEYFSDPTVDTRSTHRGVIGITHTLRPQLYAQLFYQYQWSDYENVDREDSRHIASLSFIWQINRHLFANLSGTFVDNDSDQLRASFQSAGASVGLSWQF